MPRPPSNPNVATGFRPVFYHSAPRHCPPRSPRHCADSATRMNPFPSSSDCTGWRPSAAATPHRSPGETFPGKPPRSAELRSPPAGGGGAPSQPLLTPIRRHSRTSTHPRASTFRRPHFPLDAPPRPALSSRHVAVCLRGLFRGGDPSRRPSIYTSNPYWPCYGSEDRRDSLNVKERIDP